MAGPLRGITILDLSWDAPGAYACMLLGDMGASVIKVEPLQGHPGRSLPIFYLWNRGRKSVALDQGHPKGREVLERLVKAADVLMETFLPSEVRRRHLEYEALHRLNRRLIYCALPPFGDSGPLAKKPADEGVVSAYAGVYGDQGGPDGSPVFVNLPIATYGTAFMAAYAVSAALFAREFTGLGQKVEVPWYNGALAMQSQKVVVGPQIMTTYKKQRTQRGSNPVYHLYRCQDDQWLFLACGNSTFWNKLCIALSMEALTEDPRYVDAPWGIPVEHHDSLTSLLETIFSKHPRDYWLKFLEANGIPAAPVETRSQFASHPQVQYNQMMVDVDHPTLGKTRQMGIPVGMDMTPGHLSGPAPRPGQHSREVLLDLGYTAQETEGMASSGAIGL